jgi:predicted amidohydrolase YtcJ
MTKTILLFSTIVLLATSSCIQSSEQNDVKNSADAIYYGGDIITMEGDNAKYAEAVAVKDGKIVFVGDMASASNMKGDSTDMHNLEGKTMLPGFLDAHSHYISSLSVANQLNLYPPPSGPGKDVASIIVELKRFKAENNIQDGELIQAYGYDDSVMPDGRLLNRDDLNEALPNNPVLVGHVSMHGAVLNSLAMEKWDLNEKTETAPGGIIVRKPGTNEPYGLIMETAYLPIFGSLPLPSEDEEIEWSIAAQRMYASYGITTAHEGATHLKDLQVLDRTTKAGVNLIDIIAFAFITELDQILIEFPAESWGKYQDRLKIGGVKITIDGSPQGRTAAFTTPYLTGGPSGEKDWLGKLTFPQKFINDFVKKVYDLDVPLNLHANGDGAIDAFFRAHENVSSDDLTKNRNITLIHGQFARKDQISKFVKYQITPSFYTLHTYYFADAHIANRGREQAMYISPLKDAIDAGLKPTNHTDFVVAPLDQLFMLWSAVNRISRNGEVIGENQKVTPYEGLKAMTINVAHQYQEENLKGSITQGKLADLVILDKNPMKVEPVAIKDIMVLETIKEGNTIYKKGR